MKNLSLILNIVLLLAVGFLFIQHFNHKHDGAASSEGANASSDGPRIVYVHSDSLLANYVSLREQMEDLDKRQQDADASLKKQGRDLEKEFMAIQQKIQQGLLTPNQIAQEEQRFTKKQQEVMAEQERLSSQFLRETQAMQVELETKVRENLEKLKDQYQFDYVLSYGPGTGVLLANDSLDITPKLLDLLNNR